MYDPTVGRWLSEDPIGFEAGDANLSRYVGNAATLFVDPDGLQTVMPGGAPAQEENRGSGTNIGMLAWRQNFGGKDRDALTEGCTSPPPPESPAFGPTGGTKHVAKQGHHINVPVGSLGPNDVVGTHGAGPCIGVICRTKKGPSSEIFSAHFDAQDDPDLTLHSNRVAGTNKHEYDIYIFGGDDSAGSNNTLQQCIDHFDRVGEPYTYINSSGLFMDQNGDIFRYKGSGPNPSRGNK